MGALLKLPFKIATAPLKIPILGQGLKIAAPIAATAFGGPLAGAAVGAGMGAAEGIADGKNPLKIAASAGLDIGTSMIPGLDVAKSVAVEAGKGAAKGLLADGPGGLLKGAAMGAASEGIGQGVGKLGQTMKEGPLPDVLGTDVPMIKDTISPDLTGIGKEAKKGMSTELKDALIGMGINMGTGLLSGQNPMDLIMQSAGSLGEKGLTSIFESLQKKQRNKSLYSSLDQNMDDLIVRSK